MTQKSWVLLNAKAGSVERTESAVQSELQRRAAAVHVPQDFAETRQVLREAERQGVRRIIVGGGDGTLSRVVNALAPNFGALELGLVPLGTGNDLGRSLGIAPDVPEDAVELAFEGEARAVDVVQMRDPQLSYFINAAGAGFGGEVSANLDSEDKQRWGPLAYWMTALSRVVHVDVVRVHVELDTASFERELFGITVANGRFVGGGFPIAGDALLDDGLLNVVLIPELPTLEMVSAGINVMIDRWYRPEKVETFLSRHVRIRAVPELSFSVDGEPKRKVETQFEALPGVLSLVAAPGAEALSSLAALQDRLVTNRPA